jgi:hypothetical protein
VILLSGSEVPTYATVLVDSFILKLEASRELLPGLLSFAAGRPRGHKRSKKGFSREVESLEVHSELSWREAVE